MINIPGFPKIVAMKRTIKIIIAGVFVSISVFAIVRNRQDEAVVSIDRKDSAPLFIIKDRSMLPRPLNYEVRKHNEQNYSIIYRGDKPKILYLNERPIYITPGDRVRLEYRRISEPGRERDTIIATGDHAENYTYSYLTMFNTKERKEKSGVYIPKFSNSKYKEAKHSFYDDLRQYHAVDRKYIDSVLSSRGYNSHIIRQAELDAYAMEIFGNRGDEKELLKTNKTQLADFSRKLELHFASRNIRPNDTTYSPNIENAIALYFGHLEEIKFAGVETDQQLLDMVLYIKTYPNHFVREYLLYFLMQNYEPRLKEKYLAEIKPELDKIENPVIIAALKNKVKRALGFPEGIDLPTQ